MSLPILATDRVAAAFDLIEDGVNGFVIDSSHLAEGLYAKMAFLATHDDKLREFGQHARSAYLRTIQPETNLKSIDSALELAHDANSSASTCSRLP